MTSSHGVDSREPVHQVPNVRANVLIVATLVTGPTAAHYPGAQRQGTLGEDHRVVHGGFQLRQKDLDPVPRQNKAIPVIDVERQGITYHNVVCVTKAGGLKMKSNSPDGKFAQDAREEVEEFRSQSTSRCGITTAS